MLSAGFMGVGVSGQFAGGNDGKSSMSWGEMCKGDNPGVAENERAEERDTADMGRRRFSEMEGIGGGSVPGSILVVTSVSTVLVKSTTPSRFGGMLEFSRIIPCRLLALLVKRGRTARSVCTAWL